MVTVKGLTVAKMYKMAEIVWHQYAEIAEF